MRRYTIVEKHLFYTLDAVCWYEDAFEEREVERARLRNDRYDTPRETVEVSRLGARARNCLALGGHIDY